MCHDCKGEGSAGDLDEFRCRPNLAPDSGGGKVFDVDLYPNSRVARLETIGDGIDGCLFTQRNDARGAQYRQVPASQGGSRIGVHDA